MSAKYKVQLVRVGEDGSETPVATAFDVDPSLDSAKRPYYNTAQGQHLADMVVKGFESEIDSGVLDVDALAEEQHVAAVKFHQSFYGFETYEQAEADRLNWGVK